MPLVEITVPAGTLPQAVVETVRHKVAESVLKWMGLPVDDFFAGATWVYVRETDKDGASTGAVGVDPGFLVVVTALENFLTPERNESLSAEITRIIRDTAVPTAANESPVWVVVHEIPEGYWSVNGVLTRRAKLDELIARAAGR